ncbi:hypothetical protein AMTR_s00125p00084660 [Amborella trichopoda]|uniref:Non-haem dioxygenase N-terminal domain-containing protein n=1 Tax=Amborella trichopoda TaxID=13333 RepID=W1NQ13_AMBTC|nr:hypothetical protein AMTR_s00125p00084660 [Amborella trichopoda]
MDECNPPFEKAYKDLLCDPHAPLLDTVSAQDYDLPLIDASPLLHKTGQERESCVKEIGRASSEWGFFQVVNHGISGQLLNTIRREQEKLFRLPFDKKEKLHIFKDSYRWGTPNPKTLEKFSWSEAFHIPLSGISESEEIKSLRYAIEEFTTKVADLSQKLAEALVENMGITTRLFAENCTMNSCYLRRTWSIEHSTVTITAVKHA